MRDGEEDSKSDIQLSFPLLRTQGDRIMKFDIFSEYIIENPLLQQQQKANIMSNHIN
jgi:hypothetical protein